MSDQRRNRRPDNRDARDNPARRDRREPQDRHQGRDWDRDADRNRDRPTAHRPGSRDRRGGYRERSRSPDRRNRDRDFDRNRGGKDRGSGRNRGRDGPRRQDDRDNRDNRDNHNNRDDRKGKDMRDLQRNDEDDQDRRVHRRDAAPRRSASPANRSPPPASRGDTGLPTRSRPEKKAANMSFKVNRRSQSPPRTGNDQLDDRDAPMRTVEAGDDEDEEDPDIEVAGDDDMAAMQAMLGFGGFGTTKNKKVAGNDVGAVRKEKKREYRQYMNRQGGFNRPLSPTK